MNEERTAQERSRRALPFHPVLFAVAPILFVYAHNGVRIPIDPRELLPPIALSLAVTALLWTIAGLLLRSATRAALVISLGAIISMASVLLVFQLGQPRIFFSMARDGLLPPWAAKIHPRYRTPHITTILTGVFVAFFSAFANINEVIELTNIGTLFAFILVAAGILILRIREPERKRPFRAPLIWFVAPAAIISCTYLALQLPLITWLWFTGWLLIGLVLYFLYGYKHSVEGRKLRGELANHG